MRKLRDIIDIDLKAAGLVSLYMTPGKYEYYLHLFPKNGHRMQWGFTKSHWNGLPIYWFGIGPLLLICWNEREQDNDEEALEE